MKISAVIPALNDVSNVKKLLDNLEKVKEITEIILIVGEDTKELNQIISDYSKINLVYINESQGKSTAIEKGVEESKYENILLLDSEIFGLNEYFIKAVVECYKDGFDMVILDYGGGGQNHQWIKKITKIYPALSGVRLLKKADFQKISLVEDKNSIIENKINSWFLRHNKKIAVVPGEIVKSPNELKNYPLVSGIYINTKVYRDMLLEHNMKDFPEVIKQWREIDKHTYPKKPTKIKPINVTAIIPAYNEEKNILQVLNCLKQIPELNEIIVIDDGSTDRTVEYAKSVKNVRVESNTKNLGKTKSILKGIKLSSFDSILMVDADLVGLNKSHILELIDTYKMGIDMVILDYGNQEYLLRKIIRSFPALSGVRILSKKEFNKIKFTSKDRFELENRINNHYLNHELSLIVINGDTVHTPHKYEKYSFHKGLYLEAMALKEIFLTDGVSNIGKIVKTWWDINAKRK
ncbi:glycosyltransferase [Candidatus Dojkabacteria bacterium]|nr:glycosyltransferase [Candidatus Dojkabacteria bacterium]